MSAFCEPRDRAVRCEGLNGVVASAVDGRANEAKLDERVESSDSREWGLYICDRYEKGARCIEVVSVAVERTETDDESEEAMSLMLLLLLSVASISTHSISG